MLDYIFIFMALQISVLGLLLLRPSNAAHRPLIFAGASGPVLVAFWRFVFGLAVGLVVAIYFAFLAWWAALGLCLIALFIGLFLATIFSQFSTWSRVGLHACAIGLFVIALLTLSWRWIY